MTSRARCSPRRTTGRLAAPAATAPAGVRAQSGLLRLPVLRLGWSGVSVFGTAPASGASNPPSTKTTRCGTRPTSSTTKLMVTRAATTSARTSSPNIGPPKHPTDGNPGALMRLLPPAFPGRPIPPAEDTPVVRKIRHRYMPTQILPPRRRCNPRLFETSKQRGRGWISRKGHSAGMELH
jgi:hypothetical protein